MWSLSRQAEDAPEALRMGAHFQPEVALLNA